MIKIKKMLSVAVAALLLTAALGGCSKNSEDGVPTGMMKASNDAAGYTLYIPTSWSVNETTAITTVTPGADTQTTVSCARISKSEDVTDAVAYFNSYASELNDIMPDYKAVGDTTNVLLDSNPATRFTYTGTISGVMRKYSMVVCIKGNYVYLLTLTSTDTEYDTYFDDFKSIYENIVIA